MNLNVTQTLRETTTRFVLGTPVLVYEHHTGKAMVVDVFRVTVEEDDTVSVQVHDSDTPAGSWSFITDADEDGLLEAVGVETYLPDESEPPFRKVGRPPEK